MKVIVKENLGAEYASDLISSCNQSGIQAIADYTGNEILFYDPKNWLYGRHSDMMKDASLEDDIFSIFNGKTPELRAKVLKPAKGEDFREFAVEWNNLQKQENPDIIKTKQCDMIRFGAHESGKSNGGSGMKEVMADWYRENFPSDADMADAMTDATFADLWSGLKRHSDVYDLIGVGDSTVRERLFLRLAELRNTNYKQVYMMMFKEGGNYIANVEVEISDGVFDQLNEYLEDMAQSYWEEDNMGGGGKAEMLTNLYSDVLQWLNDRGFTKHNHSPITLVVDGAQIPARDLASDILDRIYKQNEDNYTGYGESLGDDPRDWSSNEDEVEIQWMIDDKELGIESGDIETVVIDLDLVDSFEELVYQVELALEKAHGGMQFDYDDEWILVDEDKLLKRFGYNMNESGSNGGTIDVTLKFLNGHYGKKLKAGDERTIKLDTSTAPTIYDQDDMLIWIAEVASDQIPGGGEVTKYDFETIDPPDDVLIKAVMGDEGFGPDVDVDFEDFEPEDVPSEISYGEAVRFYKKMHDAYDDHKLNYTKYDKIRNKLMDAIVKGLLKEKSLDELAAEWFINYGTMNGWGWKTSFKYNIASALHEIHKKKHPDEHVVDREDTMRGWHSEKCSCGFGSSCDSSD